LDGTSLKIHSPNAIVFLAQTHVAHMDIMAVGWDSPLSFKPTRYKQTNVIFVKVILIKT
jgi:hypothetical protein